MVQRLSSSNMHVMSCACVNGVHVLIHSSARWLQEVRQHPAGFISMWDVPPTGPFEGSSITSISAGSIEDSARQATTTNNNNNGNSNGNGTYSNGNGANGNGNGSSTNGNGSSGAAASATASASTSASMNMNSWALAEFSTWKFRSSGESKRVIDQIWFTTGRQLEPIKRWKMLTAEQIGPTALPTSGYPSDHIALCCEFGWKQ